MNEPTHELEAYFAGAATDGQLRAVESWIHADSANARLFMEQLHFREVVGQHVRERADNTAGVLKELARREDQAEVVSIPGKPLGDSGKAAEDLGSLSAHDFFAAGSYLLRHSLTPKAVATLATAAALLLGVVLAVVLLGGPEPGERVVESPAPVDEPKVVATLTAERDAVWDRRPGEDLSPGQRFTLKQGFAEITTRHGAVAIVEAPASFGLIDDNNAIRLHDGRLVGLCHTASSKGFVVRTDHADITDLGTEFGVTAHADGVEAGVFAGEVAVKIGAEPSEVVKKHQAARVTLDGGRPALLVEDRLVEGYTRRMPRPVLVESARLVNGGDFQPVVAPQAFFESARLYADRGYRATASLNEALPEALLGGDVVKTPVDLVRHRNKTLIEVELTVQQAATVYVLRPPDARTGGWLERDYTNTGETVSIGDPQRGGRACEVWRRKSTVSGTTTVTWGVTADADGMYTLVVTPAETE